MELKELLISLQPENPGEHTVNEDAFAYLFAR